MVLRLNKYNLKEFILERYLNMLWSFSKHMTVGQELIHPTQVEPSLCGWSAPSPRHAFPYAKTSQPWPHPSLLPAFHFPPPFPTFLSSPLVSLPPLWGGGDKIQRLCTAGWNAYHHWQGVNPAMLPLSQKKSLKWTVPYNCMVTSFSSSLLEKAVITEKERLSTASLGLEQKAQGSNPGFAPYYLNNVGRFTLNSEPRCLLFGNF